jgi:hypothetical protein
VLGGTKVGEGSGDRLRSPAGPGQSRGRGPSYFERFHWSILNFWTLQTAEHAVPCSVAVMLHVQDN